MNAGEYMWLVYPSVALAAAIGLNAAAIPLHLIDNAIVRFAVIAAGVGSFLFAGLYVFYGFGIETVAAIFMYSFGCQLYVFLFTLVLSSVSVNIMLRLKRGTLTERQLNEIYDSATMAELRVNRLLKNNLVAYDSGRIAATTRGRRLASMFDRFRKLFGHS